MNGTEYDFSGRINANITLKATWIPISTLTYAYTGTVPTGAPAVPGAADYAEGTVITVAKAPVLDGYTFSGWNISGLNEGKMPATDVTITGSWKKNQVVNNDSSDDDDNDDSAGTGTSNTVTIDNTQVPLGAKATAGGLFIIDDEMVPLAAAPKTGDAVGLLFAMTGLSGAALAGTVFTKRKLRKKKEK